MLAEFFRFDLRHQLRSPLLWVAAFVFALFAFAATSTDFVQVNGGVGNVHRNAPAVVLNLFLSFSVLGLFIVTVFIAQPLLRDFEMGTDELFFSTPMRTRDYLAGRILAGLLASMLLFVTIAAGMLLGAAMPWVDPERLGPTSFAAYGWSLAVIILPNLLFASALLALLAVTTRSLLTVYLGLIGFIVLWVIAGYLTRDLQYETLSAMLDPFGATAILRAMRYWSASEQNTLLPNLEGNLLINRVLWLSITAVLMIAAFRLFRPQRLRAGKSRLRRNAGETRAAPAAAPVVTGASKASAAIAGPRASVRQFLHQLKFDARGVLKGVPFQVLLAFAVLNTVGGSTTINDIYETPILPVTAVMLDVLAGSYSFLLVLIIGFYAGELVWRERNAKLAELTDAMPVADWVPLLSKVGALAAVVVIFMLLGGVTTVLIQLFRGYTNLEPLLYLKGLSLLSVSFILMGTAAIFLQVIANHKFVGYFLFVLLLIVKIALPPLHLEHNLYNFAASPQAPWSDMNGYGHFIAGWAWFKAYWALFTVMLVALAAAFWVRGTEPSWCERLAYARSRMRGRTGSVLATAALAFVATGGWIFYNTNVLNEYVPSDVALDREAAYEKNYRKFKDAPQPKVLNVRADVDIFPAEHRVELRGHYDLTNAHATPITDLHLELDPLATLKEAKIPGAKLVKEDAAAGYRLYRLDKPLQPGESLTLDFTVEHAGRGFTNAGLPRGSGGGAEISPVNDNGTFFNNMNFMPHFGYQTGRQILDRGERRKRGLGEVPRAPKLEDESARQSIGFADADWINFETTVSTSADQIALAPGYLQKEWTQNGRRYFHYKMDRPMLPFFCYLSANWQVRRDRWHDVPIEIYYDAKHPYNVDRMIYAVKKSLDYFTTHFSPYQHHQVRILEFPRYATFAQSFANTIPFSESIGFIADLRDPEDIDYVFYVTAHEVAHQWWAHQVIGADQQGQAMLSESLSQYSALMVMEKEYGAPRMRKFLKYELDRYLRGRGGEIIEELPLMRVENQPYIHYQKGSLVFYRLRDEIGEDHLNRALARFVADKAYQSAPFTNTREFLDYLRPETPAEKSKLLDELFAKIVFYDNKVTAVTSNRRPDGKYDVNIQFSAAKRQADGTGKETSLPMDDFVDMGAFARGVDKKEGSEKVLYLSKFHVGPQTREVSIVVDSKPYEVGIDPYNKLIDRIPDDNRKILD